MMKYPPLLALIALAVASAAMAKPLSYHDAFVRPKPLLCEFKAIAPNKLFEKGTIFLTACDFKAEWAQRT